MNIIFARILWLCVAILLIVGGIALCSQAWGETNRECTRRYAKANDVYLQMDISLADVLSWCAENPPNKAKPKPCHWEVKIIRNEESMKKIKLIEPGWEPFCGDANLGSPILWLRREVCQ